MVSVIASSPIGRRIRSLRDARGWSQKELAYEAKVPRPWLSLVESGEIESPGAERIEKLARAFKVTSRYLLTGDDPAGAAPEDLEFQQLAPRWKRFLLAIARNAGVLNERPAPADDLPEDEI